MQVIFAFVARRAHSDFPVLDGITFGLSFFAEGAGYDIVGSRNEQPTFAIVVCLRKESQPRPVLWCVEIQLLDDAIIARSPDLLFSDGLVESGLPKMMKDDAFFVFTFNNLRPSRTREYRAVIQQKDDGSEEWRDAYSFVFAS